MNNSKKSIDKLEKNEYNLNEVSEYASKMLQIDRYDEVEAEYHVNKLLKKGD